ncbi:precorrin-8X methylmutase [Thermodesulfovibrionales bacterium]|nr:precorrin-8X methylmutase [Thermodesulfovibrionales bacterium]
MKPLIYKLYEASMTGLDVEKHSLAIIDKESPGHTYDQREWKVVQRLIHTTADFSLIEMVRFSADAIDSGIDALRKGARIYTDSNMIRSGLSLFKLTRCCPKYNKDLISCHVTDPDVVDEARTKGLPRSLFAIRKAKEILNNGIVLIGNAPIALLELNRMIMEEALRPALVVGMPVGFVHVIESKEELAELDVPHISLMGRRGGSPLAVSVIHALLEAEREGER